MLPLLMFLSSLASLQDPAAPPDKPSPKAEADSAEARNLADYNGRRDKTAATAAAQWKLATWCEQVGLKPEAYVHFARVIELDPKRDDAWRKLGFKKHDGRWMTDRQIAAEAEAKKADATWGARLKEWHKLVHDRKKPDPDKRAGAQAELDKVNDPAAVAAIIREFGGGSAADQAIAVTLLSQIDSPLASKEIAMLAVYGKSPNTRRLATETLRGRPADHYLDLLVSLMKDPLRYEVRPVGGPGSPGVLFVEGERFNLQRFYAPPPVVTVNPRPGDIITYDSNGLPIVVRENRQTLFVGPQVSATTSKTKGTELDGVMVTTDTYSYGNALIEANQRAAAAQSQLAGDVARIEATNKVRRDFTDLVAAVARSASGKASGNTAKEWREALATENDRYARRPVRKPTLTESVPLDFVPNLVASIARQSEFRALLQPVIDH